MCMLKIHIVNSKKYLENTKLFFFSKVSWNKQYKVLFFSKYLQIKGIKSYFFSQKFLEINSIKYLFLKIILSKKIVKKVLSKYTEIQVFWVLPNSAKAT